MSGIAGIIRFNNGSVEPELVKKMTSSMSYRGPDGINHWIKGSVAMGHCMLSTTPESIGEIQPLTNENESLVLVLDGRLDNRQDLIREIRQKNIPSRSNTDAELVLCAYQLWGENCPNYLLGDFAFTIWDAHRGKLFCARDHIGVKPFYYVKGENYFAFASDEHALLVLPGVSNKPCDDHIAQLLSPTFGGDNFNTGWLKDVTKLSAGQALSIEQSGQHSIRSYWQLEPMDEFQFSSDEECEEVFNSVFNQSIRSRLRIIGNPALMLSGGIDSASIAASTREILHEFPKLHLETFSVISDDSLNCEETINIRSISTGFKKHTHFTSMPSYEGNLSEADFLEGVWKYPHPIHNSIPIPALMYQAAKRSGSRVMFDGIDGDLVASSPGFYISKLIRSGNFRQSWMESGKASVNHTYMKRFSRLSIYSRNIWSAYAPSTLQVLRQNIRIKIRANPFEGSLISRDFAASINLEERIVDQILTGQRRSSHESEQQRLIRIFFQQGIPWSMEAFNQVASCYGIEPRHPWSDKRVIEFFFRLPQHYKVRDGWTKWLVRKAMVNKLETNVCWHSGKNHLSFHLVNHLMKNNRDQVLESIISTEGVLGDYVEMDLLKAYLRTYKKGIDHMNPDQLWQLYETAALGRWLSLDNSSNKM